MVGMEAIAATAATTALATIVGTRVTTHIEFGAEVIHHCTVTTNARLSYTCSSATPQKSETSSILEAYILLLARRP